MAVSSTPLAMIGPLSCCHRITNRSHSQRRSRQVFRRLQQQHRSQEIERRVAHLLARRAAPRQFQGPQNIPAVPFRNFEIVRCTCGRPAGTPSTPPAPRVNSDKPDIARLPVLRRQRSQVVHERRHVAVEHGVHGQLVALVAALRKRQIVPRPPRIDLLNPLPARPDR